MTATPTDTDHVELPSSIEEPTVRMKAPPARRSKIPYVLLIPAVLALVAGLGYPIYWQLTNSMMKYGQLQQFGAAKTRFVWFENYANIFAQEDLHAVVLRSIAFCIVNAGLTVLLGTLFALLMNAVPKGIKLVLQISLLFAWATPMVAAVTVWKWLFDDRAGVINWLLVQVGLESYDNHNWLDNPLSFFFVATVIIVWMSVPFVALSVYAGLTQVNGDILEAAQIDGATGWQTFWSITFPMIRPVVSIVLLLQIIWDLRVFAQIHLLQDTGGSPSDTNLLGNFIYQLGVGSGNFGGAAAVSLFVLALTIVLSWPYVRSLLKEEES